MISTEAIQLVQDYMEHRLDASGEGRLALLLSESAELVGWFRAQVHVECLFRASSAIKNLEFRDRRNEGSRIERLLLRDARFYDRPSSEAMDTLARQAAEQAARQADEQARRVSASIRPTVEKRSPVPWRYIIAPVAVFLAMLMFREWRPAEQDVAFPAPPVSRQTASAVLTGLDEVRWSESDAAPKLGESLGPGPLSFESGTVELLYFNGVRAVVEGPAELLMISEKQTFCGRGKWSVDVPPQGVGFEIRTPDLTIRDLGTRFRASVEDDVGEVHVLQGTVEMERHGTDGKVEKWTLKTNQGASLRRGEAIARFAARTGGFIDRLEMRRRFEAFWSRNGPKTVSPEAIRGSAICSVDCDKDPIGDATVFGGSWSDGGEPDSRAFRFDDKDARIRLKPMEKAAAVTVVMRLCVHRLHGDINPVLMSEGAGRGGIACHISPRGTLLLGLRPREGRYTETFETPVLLTDDRLGRWFTLAVCFDSAGNRISAYRDGEPVFVAQASAMPSPDPAGLDVGNWRPRAGQRNNFRNLDGAVRKVLVFDRALKFEEIRRLSE